jgi:hypothetical protein
MQLGHHPLSAFGEIYSRFCSWLRTSEYVGMPSALNAEDELLCRFHAIRRLMETL